MHERLRQIPKTDALLADIAIAPYIARLGRSLVVEAIHAGQDATREAIRAGVADDVAVLTHAQVLAALAAAERMPVSPVINATGIILHTNLGRSALGRELIDAVSDQLARGVSVEMSLDDGKRGVRGEYARKLLANLCGAEDALIVNNNAAAILLILSSLAAGKDVVISRGELIQIGGGFRIPDIITQGGARLVEVGTSNITTLEDYSAAIGETTGALLKVHQSNFSQRGFAKRPTTKELAALKNVDLPLIEDLGSGCLLSEFAGRRLPDPTPQQTLSDGADLVCFSGDKLLGGPQAGLIVGRKDLIARLSRFPLMRAIRPDKLTYLLLQEVLKRYDSGRADSLSPWRFLARSQDELQRMATAIFAKCGTAAASLSIRNNSGEYGGGSLPGEVVPSVALVVEEARPDAAAAFFRQHAPHVLGVVNNGAFCLDLLAVEPDELDAIAARIRQWYETTEIQ